MSSKTWQLRRQQAVSGKPNDPAKLIGNEIKIIRQSSRRPHFMSNKNSIKSNTYIFFGQRKSRAWYLTNARLFLRVVLALLEQPFRQRQACKIIGGEPLIR